MRLPCGRTDIPYMLMGWLGTRLQDMSCKTRSPVAGYYSNHMDCNTALPIETDMR
jgi:hypothetical protein